MKHLSSSPHLNPIPVVCTALFARCSIVVQAVWAEILPYSAFITVFVVTTANPMKECSLWAHEKKTFCCFLWLFQGKLSDRKVSPFSRLFVYFLRSRNKAPSLYDRENESLPMMPQLYLIIHRSRGLLQSGRRHFERINFQIPRDKAFWLQEKM